MPKKKLLKSNIKPSKKIKTKSKHKRPSWDEYFLDIMNSVSKRGTCDRGRSGCVIVKDKRLVVAGYVGAPAGVPHCDEVGHELQEVLHPDGSISKHCIRTSHAEQNALVQAAKLGISVDGSTLYCHMEPCYVCAKMIINAGIKRVVVSKKYHGAKRTREVFKQAGVKLKVLNNETVTYRNM